MIDDEYKEAIEKFNEGLRGIMDWHRKHQNDLFFETEDGVDLTKCIGEIVVDGALLNLKTLTLVMEEAILNKKAAESDDAD